MQQLTRIPDQIECGDPFRLCGECHDVVNLLHWIVFFAFLIGSTACRSSDIDVEKVAAGEGYLLLDAEGQEIRIPVKEMEIYLVDPAYDDKYPEKFEISGPDLHLVGTFPMDVHVSYGEHFDRMLHRTIDIEASGNPSRREEVDSSITIPNQEPAYVDSGTLQVTEVIKPGILQGNIFLQLENGRAVSGTFVFSATTWG